LDRSGDVGGGAVILYVPWAVFRELDALKSREEEDLARRARAAIRFLNELLTSRHPRVRAQSGAEEREAEAMYHRADNEDDRVLQACLRVRSTATGATGAAAAAVVLYTNDRNLANKSIASGIDAYSSVSLIPGLTDKMEQLRAAADRPQRRRGKHAAKTATAQGGAGGGGGGGGGSQEEVGQAFQRVAFHIYLMTWHYCSRLGVPFKTAPPPSNPEKAAFAAGVAAEPRRVVKHLTQVYRVTSRLGTSMCDCLRADPRALTAAHDAVAELHEALRSAGAELRRHAPPHFPQMQKLPPTFGPTGLVAHVLRPESRAALDVGLDQLQSFKREQLECLEVAKLRTPISSAIKKL